MKLLDRSHRHLILRNIFSFHLPFLLLASFLLFYPYPAHSKGRDENNLIARIMVPATGSMVRGDVPVYGLAYGGDFKEYTLEYGYGVEPEEWHLIVTSVDAQQDIDQLKNVNYDLVKTISGNLGMWATGLSEYPYADYPVDLPMGTYTLRLKVAGLSGREVMDTVSADVGRVILNCCEVRVASPDGQASLVVPEHSLPEVAKVISLVPLKEIPSGLKDDSELRLKSDLYRLCPAGQTFSGEVVFRIKTARDAEANVDHTGICRHDPSTGNWRSLPTVYDQTTKSYFTKITDFPDRLAIFGLFESEKILNTRSNGLEARRVIPSSNIMVHNTFDDGPGQWENRYGQMGGVVSVVEEGCLSGKCLKVESGGNEGNLGVSGISSPFDARIYPIMEFDYKMASGTKVNILIKTGGMWYDLVFTDDEKYYWDINMEKIGEISDVKADGQWHHVAVNLYELLKVKTDRFIVEDLIFADWDATGFKKLAFGRAREGAQYYLDEFRIVTDRYFSHIDVTSAEKGGNGPKLPIDISGDYAKTGETMLSFYVDDLEAPLRLIITPEKTDQPVLWFHQNRVSVEVNSKILKTLTYGAGGEDMEMMIPGEYLNNGMNSIQFKDLSSLNQFGLQRIQIKK